MYIAERFMRECPLIQRHFEFLELLDERGFEWPWIEEYSKRMSTTERLCVEFGLSLFSSSVKVNMGKLVGLTSDQPTLDCVARYVALGLND